MEHTKALFKTEGMSLNYIEEQLEGLALELSQKYKSETYIKEKCDNIIRHFSSTVENFKNRIMVKEVQEEFKQRLEEVKQK